MQLIVVLFLVLVVLVLVSVSLSADTDMDSQVFWGKEAKDGQFPYHVGLYYERIEKEKQYFCGGALISETFVLTAAHCIDGISVEIILVSLGSIYHTNGTERRAHKKIIHDMYNKTGIVNDIALLQIEQISYTDNIEKINLPAFSDLNETYDAHIAVHSGWGYTNASRMNSEILQFTYFLVLSKTACAKLYGEQKREDVLCAADPDMSTGCSGDSGGPLVDMDSKTLIGVTSFGPAEVCGDIYFGTGYMRVTSYRQWIKDHTGI